MENVLRSLISTLNQIDVRGKDNMDRLLGCIQTLEQLLDIVTSAKDEPKGGAGNETDHQPGK